MVAVRLSFLVYFILIVVQNLVIKLICSLVIPAIGAGIHVDVATLADDVIVVVVLILEFFKSVVVH